MFAVLVVFEFKVELVELVEGFVVFVEVGVVVVVVLGFVVFVVVVFFN